MIKVLLRKDRAECKIWPDMLPVSRAGKVIKIVVMKFDGFRKAEGMLPEEQYSFHPRSWP